MRPIQFNLKVLLVVILIAAVGLGAYNFFFPFYSLQDDSTCSISDAAEYRGTDSIRVNLAGAFTGTLKLEYIDPRVTPANDIPIYLNSATINPRGHGSQFEPKLEMSNFSHGDDPSCQHATLVDEMPSLEKLKTVSTVSQYVELLGEQRYNFEAQGQYWQIFRIVNDKEIEVMNIFLHHEFGRGDDPILVLKHGFLKSTSQ